MTDQPQIKASWRLGNVEIHYEGSENFLKTDFPKLFQELLEIFETSSRRGAFDKQEPLESMEMSVETPANRKLELGVNTVATKLGVKEGKGLALAACAYLVLVKQKSTFSREDIRDAMKDASHYYTETHRKSLTSYISTLMKEGHLLERSPNIYALQKEKLRQLEATLAS